ncbi:cytochrome-c peroxidase [Flavobacterium alkalisoli]|uniref:Cytochrome-c peroxidase n=1 Tax=Flavobacterium alkalisoli TaxID=2602769 RepID=A0A5B9FU11_9FLAO|nr:cytochrome c peroxidase [Flavobacterium alkalisoli]QEE49751.1 cytochrome-c peroxidase [Flavobacterium alkalisoli]
MSAYYKKTVFALAIAFFALVFISFSGKTSSTPPQVITNYFSDFSNALEILDNTANSYRQGKITLDSLQHTLKDTRISYKKVEFFLAFYYAEYVNSHINGAPLMQIEKEGTRPKVVSPEGLQVLDELVFSDEADKEKSKIAAVAKNVKSKYGVLYNSLSSQEFKNQYNLTAMRLQLVRIFSMGVTGFDTPGSLNGIEESRASFEGMLVFFTENYNQGNIADKNKVIELFKGGLAYLNSSESFEDFDRLTFLKTYIDPLYKKLGEMQGNNIPEYLKQTSGWNPESTSVFAADFLNPYYFTELNKEDDSEALRKLGKSLFYDPVLSSDGSLSCASCHNPEKGFTDGVPKSLSSVQGKTVLRNAPTLLNAVYADRYFYDLRAFSLEQQAEHVIFNHEEFNTAYSDILKKLENDNTYADQFKKVFGKSAVNRENFSKALVSYVLSLKSFDSPFDKYVRGELEDIPAEVKRGFNLFTGKANCATCHFAPTFSGLVPPFYNENESEILGVLVTPDNKSPQLDGDLGRINNQVLTEYAWIYERSFKTTTIRNVQLTAPYFHNGAYSTLEEVIDFYDNGGGEGLGLSVTNQTLGSDALDLTEQEKKDLVAFLKSLTDLSAIEK